MRYKLFHIYANENECDFTATYLFLLEYILGVSFFLLCIFYNFYITIKYLINKENIFSNPHLYLCLIFSIVLLHLYKRDAYKASYYAFLEEGILIIPPLKKPKLLLWKYVCDPTIYLVQGQDKWGNKGPEQYFLSFKQNLKDCYQKKEFETQYRFVYKDELWLEYTEYRYNEIKKVCPLKMPNPNEYVKSNRFI